MAVKYHHLLGMYDVDILYSKRNPNTSPDLNVLIDFAPHLRGKYSEIQHKFQLFDKLVDTQVENWMTEKLD